MDLTDLLSSRGTEQVSEQGVGMEDASQKAGRGQDLGTGRRSRGLGRSPVPGPQRTRGRWERIRARSPGQWAWRGLKVSPLPSGPGQGREDLEASSLRVE